MTIKMSTYVHILKNPTRIITVNGNLNDNSTWRKSFAKPNGNIFNGIWLIGLKSFSYYIKVLSLSRTVSVHCNVVNGFEQNRTEAAKHCNPPIAQVLMSGTVGTQNKDFDYPSFFVINNVSDMLELDFTYFPTATDLPFVKDSTDVKFEAVFHYFCQSNS
jgi:hypothetical protein